MRLPTYTRKGSMTFNMTPMIDVTFLLIVFFLVSSHLARQEAQLELALPAAETGQMPESEVRRVVINVLPEGEIRAAGRAVSEQQLRDMIAAERDAVGNELEIRIRADRSAPYQHVEPIMVASAKAGIWNVTFAVIERIDR